MCDHSLLMVNMQQTILLVVDLFLSATKRTLSFLVLTPQPQSLLELENRLG